MNPVDPTAVDLLVFLKTMHGERQPTVVVHGSPLCGKSRFAQALAKSKDWLYLDILSVVSIQPGLAGKIDRFEVCDLEHLILEKTASADVVIIDDLDFLFPLWGDLRPFKEMVRKFYNPDRSVVYVFFLQSRHDWDDWNLFTAGHKNRVFAFEIIKPL